MELVAEARVHCHASLTIKHGMDSWFDRAGVGILCLHISLESLGIW